MSGPNPEQPKQPLVLGIESSCDETGVGNRAGGDHPADQHGVVVHG